MYAFTSQKRAYNMKIKKKFFQSRVSYKRRERWWNGTSRRRYRISISRFVCRFESFSEIPSSDKGAVAICRFYVYVKTVTSTTYIVY